MWDETGSVRSISVLSRESPFGGFIVSQSTANQRIAIASAAKAETHSKSSARQRVVAVGMIDNICRSSSTVTLPPSRINRLPHAAFTGRCERFFALKPCRQQIRWPGKRHNGNSPCYQNTFHNVNPLLTTFSQQRAVVAAHHPPSG